MSYILCGLVMQPLWATISDAFGRKPPLYICMALFAIGSIVFALAQNMTTLIIGRVLQGFGGGGLDILSDIILADMTTLKERSFYLGLMAIPSSVGNIMGPTVGAIFSNYVSWRWIGWINLPFLGIAAPLLIFFLNLRPIKLDSTLTANLNRLDWIGMILIVTGITIFVLPMSWAGSIFPWRSWQTLLPMCFGILVIIVFVIYEAKPVTPVVPHRLFHSKTANMTLLGAFVHGMILLAILQYLPLFYQAVGAETAIKSAVSLLPTSITSVVIAVIAMMLVSVVGGRYAWIIRISWMILTLGTGLLALFGIDSSSSMNLGLPILWGAGVASLRLLLLPIQASVKHVDDTGMAIGQLLAIRMFGGLVGLTVASSIFNTVFSDAISSLGSLTGPLAPLANPNNAVAFIPELRLLDISPELLNQVLDIYLKGFKSIFYTMAGVGGIGIVTSFFIEDLDLSNNNESRQRFEE